MSLAVSLLVLAFGGLISCGTTSSLEIKNPEILLVGNGAEPSTLDPIHTNESYGAEVILNVYENLIAFDRGSMTEFVPLLATEVPSEQNGLIAQDADGNSTINFPIRENVLFHDGTELTPEDVAYSFQRVMIHSHPNSQADTLLQIFLDVSDLDELASEIGDQASCERVKSSVKVIGSSVILTVLRPVDYVLTTITLGNALGSITNRNYVMENGGWDGDCASWRDYYALSQEDLALHDRANGTGPFRLERWTAGDELVLVRHEDFWQGPAKLAGVRFQVIPEIGTRKLLFEEGDLDIIVADRSIESQLAGRPGIRGMTHLPSISNTSANFGMDMEPTANPFIGSGQLDGNGIPPDFFSDIDVRKGFSYAFNYSQLNDEVLEGRAVQSRGPIPWIVPYHNAENPYYVHDLDKAKEHLQRAWNGELWEKGFRMTLIHNAGNITGQAISEILKENLESLNDKFIIETQAIQWPTMIDHFQNKRVPIFAVTWSAGAPNPYQFIYPYLCKEGLIGGPSRIDVVFDICDRIKEAQLETDLDRRRELYFEFQRLATEQATSIFLSDQTASRWQRTWVDGWMYNPTVSGRAGYLHGVSKKKDGKISSDFFEFFPDAVVGEW